MSKGGGSVPQAPDPYETANAQSQYARDALLYSAALNQMNQVTPWGTVTYSGDFASGYPGSQTSFQSMPEPPAPYQPPSYSGGSDDGWGILGSRSRGDSRDGGYSDYLSQYQQYLNSMNQGGAEPSGNPRTATLSLSPEMQQQFDQQLSLANELYGQSMGQLGDIEGLGEIGDYSDAEQRQRIEDAMYSRAMRLMEPQYSEMERRMNTDLSNRGLPFMQEAWQDATNRFDQQRYRALQDAADQSILAGSGEASRLFGEDLARRSQLYNELAALTGNTPQFQMPQMPQAAQYQQAPADIMRAFENAYAGEMNAYNINQQNASSSMGGLLGLAGSLAPLFL